MRGEVTKEASSCKLEASRFVLCAVRREAAGYKLKATGLRGTVSLHPGKFLRATRSAQLVASYQKDCSKPSKSSSVLNA
jgi:hypothetical protein